MATHKEQPRVSLKMLAEYLGLSQGTVSMALSPGVDSTGVAKKTKERVLKAAAELNYRPNYHARSLSSGRSHTIGVILPTISEGYYSALLSSIEVQLMAADYFFFVASHRWDRALLGRLPANLLSRGAEGLIFINTPCDAELSLPSVRIGGSKPHRNSTNLCLDEERGTWLALEHLYSLGHRQIAFIRGEPESTATLERWAGIRKAARTLGLKIDPQLTLQLQLGGSRGAARYSHVGYEAASELMAHNRPFTALLAYNDATAIGAMRAFQDAGRRVPAEISVVGYDDIPAAEYERPALTTVRQPLESMGALATRVLLEAIGGKPEPDRLLVAPELRVRASTGPAPVSAMAPRPPRKRVAALAV